MIEEQAKLYLCRPNGNLLTQLNGVRTDSVEYAVHVKDYNEITFIVDRYINVDGELVESNGYEDLRLNMNVLLEGKDVFQLQEPTVTNDGTSEYKTIKGYSREKEFEDKDWVGLKVNTGEEDSLEYLIDGNIDEYGFAKEYITIYRGNNSGKTDFSLIHLILQKMPGWSVDDNDIDHLLWTRKISISEDNINLYALLTNVMAPKAECLFLFDTINKKIKAVAKEHLDDWSLDSNIFISMRNLANQIDVQVDEDSVFTVFTPQGENELNVRGANYNDAYVYDLSYFKAEPWMTTDLVTKINAWETWRDDNRDDFIQLSKDRAAKNAELYDVDYKVPNDADVWTQWDNMDTELLQKNLEVFQKQLEFLQVSVDPNPQYDSQGNYIPHKTSGGAVDHDYYLNLLQDNNAGYYTYLEIYQYVIPNIQIAIRNKGVVEDQKEEYIKSYETNWELYGIIELEAKEEGYKQQMETLKQYAKSWSQLPAADKAKYVNEDTYNIYHNEYVKFKNYLGSSSTAGSLRYKLAQLRQKRKTLENQLATIDNNILTYVNTAKIDNQRWGLTADELITFRTLCHHTDYTNSNILTTSIDTTISTVDVEYELYQDAVSKLSEVSRPQFSFQVDLDNLLNIPEFASWVDDFELLRFMRLGIRDDFSVKLRLTGYTTNPCEIDPNLTLEFSSFITSKSGRSDLTDLLNSENNRGSKNSITIGTGTSKDDKEYLLNLLTMLTRSGMFTSAVQGVASNVFTVGSVSANAIYAGSADIDDAHINNLIAEYIDAGNINVDKITGREAWFQTMEATYINSEYIVSKIITAESGDFDDLTASSAFIQKLNSGLIEASTINVENITGTDAQFNELFSHYIDADYIITDILSANRGRFTTLVADVFSNATGHIFNLTADNATVNQAFIDNQIANKISVADLKAHAATADQIVLISSDGDPGIAFQNATQQFYDSNGNVRVQIGQDANGDFNMIIRGADGTTALFNQNGITQSGIPNNTIVNNMITNGTIQKGKLAFNIIEPNAQGGIDITDVYDGSGNLWGTQYTSFKDATNTAIAGVSSMLDMTNGTIKDSVWNKTYVTVENAQGQEVQKLIKEAVTDNTTSINGITSRVSATESTLDTQGNTITNLQTNVSTIEQTANKINLLVESGSSSSSLTLTDALIQAVSNNIVIMGEGGSGVAIQNGVLTIGQQTKEAIAYLAINGGLLCYVQDDDPSLNTNNGEPIYTAIGEQINVTGIRSLKFDNADEDENGGWVYFSNVRKDVPYFEVEIYLDYFPHGSGYIVNRNDTQYAVYYNQTTNKWYSKLTDLTTVTAPEWTWDRYNDMILGEYIKQVDGTTDFTFFTPAKTYSDIRPVVMLRNLGVSGYIIENTTINGGHIETGTITSNALSTDAIMSRNYNYIDGFYSEAGTFLDLQNGMFRSKNFYISDNGDAYFKGNIVADTGKIGGENGFVTASGKITSGNVASVNDTSHAGVYIGVDGINISGGTSNSTTTITQNKVKIGDKFLFQNGTLTITGNINATQGTIGGFIIDNTSIQKPESDDGVGDTIYFGRDGLSITDKFSVNVYGNLTAKAGLIGGYTIGENGFRRGASFAGQECCRLNYNDLFLSNGTLWGELQPHCFMQGRWDDGNMVTYFLLQTSNQSTTFSFLDDGIVKEKMSISSERVSINDDLTVFGNKNRVIKTKSYGDRLLYSYEMPEPYFGDIGESQIGSDGFVQIYIEEIFSETISTDLYQVFLQSYGDGKLFVYDRQPSYFIVCGTSGLRFGWEIKAKQIDHNNKRLEIL